MSIGGWRRAAVAALACVGASASAQDSVVLDDGERIEGRVVWDHGGELIVRVGSKDVELDAARAREVRSLARSQREALERWESGLAREPGALLDLATFCKGRGLSGEAELFAWVALDLDAGYASAHEFLGHEWKGGRWRVPIERGSRPYSNVLERRMDFDDGWRLRSLHFELRTNLPLEQACATLLELEFAHRAFFDWLRPHARALELVEPITVQVHADHRSYPGGSGSPGYYSPTLNTAFLDASEGLAPGALAHEAAHGLLYNSMRRTRRALGSLPSWLDEGLAETLNFARSGELGRPRYDLNSSASFYFKLHAGSDDPLELSRVLALTTEDFVFSSHMGLAYAQSYTLVQFGLHDDGGARREAFFAYLRGCFEGRSAVTAFKEAFGLGERELEQAWTEFVRARA